jgi:hypothetical protein
MPRKKKVKEVDTKEFVEDVGKCLDEVKAKKSKTKPKTEVKEPKPKKEAKPKKVNQWMVFLKDFRAKNPNLSLKEAMKLAKIGYAEQKAKAKKK